MIRALQIIRVIQTGTELPPGGRELWGTFMQSRITSPRGCYGRNSDTGGWLGGFGLFIPSNQRFFDFLIILSETSFTLVVGVESPECRKPKLTCDYGTDGKENVVNGHHRRCAVEFRGLIQEPRAEDTY